MLLGAAEGWGLAPDHRWLAGLNAMEEFTSLTTQLAASVSGDL
jgi:hypothetical protein